MIFHLPSILRNNAQWLEKKQNSILSAAFIITIANVLSSLSGLFKERFLVSAFFHTAASQKAYEAFQIAFQIPDLAFQLIILGALSSAFIPIFAKYKNKSLTDAFKLSNVIMNLLLLIFFLVSIIIFIFAKPLIELITGEAVTAEQIIIAGNLTKIMLLSQFFFAVSNFFTGILQSFQRFIVASLAPVLYNLGIIIGVLLFSKYLDIYAAGVGVVIGAFLHMAIQLPFVFRLGYRFQLSFDFKFPGVKEMFSLMPLRVLTIGVNQLQNIGLGFFATSIGNLSFVTIRLALRLMTLPIRIFGVPISQASLPFLSEETDSFGKEKFKQLVMESLNQIAFFSLPASVLLLILRIPIVRLVYGTNNFPWKATLTTGRIVAIIAISIVAQAMVQLFIRAFHALKDTKTPFYISLITIFLYLFGCFMMVFVLKSSVLGIALITSLVAFVELFLYVYFIEKKISGLIIQREFLFNQAKILCANFMMAIFLYLPFRIFDQLIFDTTRTVELIALTIITSSIAVFVYIYFCLVLKIKELKYLGQILEKFGKWKKPLEQTQEVLLESSIDHDDLK